MNQEAYNELLVDYSISSQQLGGLPRTAAGETRLLGAKVERLRAELTDAYAAALARIAELESPDLNPESVRDGGIVETGHHGTAMAGYHGTATVGDHGTATVGDGGKAMAGYHGTALAGDHGAAIVGDHGTAIAGHRGTAMAGRGGTLIIFYYDSRLRVAVGYIGEDGLLPNVAYCLNDNHEFVRA